MGYIELKGILKKGHQVASGLAADSPYPFGTIEMQAPIFEKAGIDLKNKYLATLNVSIEPHIFKMVKPSVTLKDVKWSPDHPAETFSFSPCKVVYDGRELNAYVYYPHPDTKIGHHQDESTLEIISEKIGDIEYGKNLLVKLTEGEIEIKEK